MDRTMEAATYMDRLVQNRTQMHITGRMHRVVCIMEHRDRICILAVHFTPAISMQDITARPAIHQLTRIHLEMLHRVQELPRRI